MSAATRRYLKHWLEFAQTHQNNLALIESEYDQIDRVWQMLGGSIEG